MADCWAALDRVADPEMPVISIVQLGIVRDVIRDGARCTVIFSPTFLACPATKIIAQNISEAVRALGLEPDVQVSLAEAWTLDRITEGGREALKGALIGIRRAKSGPSGERDAGETGLSGLQRELVPCPNCDSEDTSLFSAFGSTRCRAVRRCNSCHNHFEQIKAI